MERIIRRTAQSRVVTKEPLAIDCIENVIARVWRNLQYQCRDGNLLAGGGFTVYCDAQFNSNPITGVSFTNNHMKSGGYGITNFNKTSPTYTGNVNDGATLLVCSNTTANADSGTTSPACHRGRARYCVLVVRQRCCRGSHHKRQYPHPDRDGRR